MKSIKDCMLKKIDITTINDNTFKLIGKDWMLITAGDKENFNTMTAAWGGLGFLWNKNVCFTFIRPNRYTYEFSEKHDTFTLTFFAEKYKEALMFCGTKSGRDVDKCKETGLTPVETEEGNIIFEEARISIEFRKLYYQDLDKENFLTPEIIKCYPDNCFHRMYIGEVMNCYVKGQSDRDRDYTHSVFNSRRDDACIVST